MMYYIISFDMKNLYTKTPVDLALRLTEERLNSDASLPQRTKLNTTDIMRGLNLCVNNTYFSA